ncbi:gamma-glutamyltransferase family protein [Henriciella aquimarina]|uniref:gamma-glutamyltransferase family protein n=1 Tax=Henriciella aquimarina TaxID=545261 RepID=UPI0009FC45D0|nr:gamma-glutamyltransferase family protein [Henriciella aquimarina]
MKTKVKEAEKSAPTTGVAEPDRRTMLKLALAGSAGVGLSACAGGAGAANTGTDEVLAPDAPEAGAMEVKSYRVEVPGPNGVVSAGHPLASSAGLRILTQGGSAADASVATMAVLNLVEPWASSIAGNGFGTVYDPESGDTIALKYGGAAPMALDPASDPEVYDWGVKAATTPGAFGGWIALMRRYGRLSLKEVFAPAIEYARKGHPMDPSIAWVLDYYREKIAQNPTTAAIFLPGGEPPEPRAILKNPDLANTFEQLVDAEQKVLASGGDRDTALKAALDYFYTGPIAEEVDRFFREVGGWLRKEDMAAYKAEWAPTVSTTYRGYGVHSTPPTSRGGLEVCMQANLLEQFDISGMKYGDPRLLHLQAEAIKFAKADIYAYVADPKFHTTPLTGMLSKEYAQDRAALIAPRMSSPFPPVTDFRPYDPSAPAPPEPITRTPDDDARFSDTASLTVVDGEGLAVVMTTTLGGGFGAGVVAGRTGFLLNNGMRLGSTSPYPENPNFVAPGQIPILNNSPVLVTQNGRLHAAFGTPGGETIGQSEFQVLVNLLDHEMGIQDAIEAPRFSMKADPNFYLAGAACTLQLENRFGASVADTLRAMGHDVSMVGPLAIGSIQGARLYENGAVMAGADPRRMAMAAGF